MNTVYLDFSKAFDSVPHKRLMVKMENYGITGNILGWCKHFLSDRRQRVVINGEKSVWERVISGVSQGSVIGPTMFVLFINDMPEVVTSCIEMFADDAKIFKAMLTKQDRCDLQGDLDNLQNWAITWKMKFNADKCKVLHLGSQNPRYEYTMCDICLEAVREENDLGVIVDEKLKFDTHTVTQANKVNRVLGLIRRTFDNLDEEMLVLLYKSLVRPHLEYCHAVVYPQYVKQEKMLEAVKRRATRLVPKIRKNEYPERLEKLKLPTLAYRRRRGDMIEVYKYTHNTYNVAVQHIIMYYMLCV